MKKNISVYEVLNQCQLGDILGDGTRTWKVVEIEKECADCIIAVPYRWNKKKMGEKFELWSDAQSMISFIPNLKKKSQIK